MSHGALLNPHPSRKTVVICVVMGDGLLGIAPTVVAFSIVEVHEPEPFGFEAEGLELGRPAVDDVPEGGGEGGMFGIVFGHVVELRGKRLGPAHGIGGHVLDVRQQVARCLKRENGPGLR